MVSRWCAQEGKLEEESLKRKRLFGAGRKPLSEELEDQLMQWIKHRRALKVDTEYLYSIFHSVLKIL